MPALAMASSSAVVNVAGPPDESSHVTWLGKALNVTAAADEAVKRAVVKMANFMVSG